MSLDEMTMASEKYKKLAKNSIAFLIGNLGSKIITFFIVPFYTYYLTTAEYGTADLITTTVNLISPFAMLGMNEAALRFSASKEESPKSIASNSLLVVLCGWVIFWLLFPLFRAWSIIGEDVIYFLVLLCLTSFNTVFLQLLRGIGKSKAFAANGVLITFVTAAANIVSLAILHLGVAGYLGSMVLAQLVGAVHIICCSKLWRLISWHDVNRSALRSMLIYCIPLIPNSLMWWVMSVSDRYVILYFLGASANGIYNVSQKIPSIVNVIYTVFTQAWQVSAIEERDSKDNSHFQSTVFRYIFVALALVSSLVAASAFPVYEFLMSSEYEGAWQYVAMLSFANFLFCIGSFFGVNYVATKQSKKAFSTSAIGAITNVLLTLVLVPAIGIMGAALATAISYAVIAVIRCGDTKKIVEMTYDRLTIVLCFVVLVLQVLISLFPYHPALLGFESILFFVLIFIIRRDLENLLQVAGRMVKQRFSRGRE